AHGDDHHHGNHRRRDNFGFVLYAPMRRGLSHADRGAGELVGFQLMAGFCAHVLLFRLNLSFRGLTNFQSSRRKTAASKAEQGSPTYSLWGRGRPAVSRGADIRHQKPEAAIPAASTLHWGTIRYLGASSSSPCSNFSWHSMQWRVQGTASRRLGLISLPQ